MKSGPNFIEVNKIHRMTLEGRSSAEISRILPIDEGAVKLHMKDAKPDGEAPVAEPGTGTEPGITDTGKVAEVPSKKAK